MFNFGKMKELEERLEALEKMVNDLGIVVVNREEKTREREAINKFNEFQFPESIQGGKSE